MDAITTLDTLKHEVQGAVFTPEDATYDELRLPWNRSTSQYPALILVPETVEDVIAGVHYARANNLNIAVQATGHGLQKAADDALLIITSRLKSVTVDVHNATVRAGAGSVWQDALDQVLPHGLAPLLGSSPNVGIIGYTLGGGVGWLTRRYGLAADSVLSIELVTADGMLRTVYPDDELYWGLLGGGGNFGVVTAIEFKLYPVRSVYGGTLHYSADNLADSLRFYREWLKTIPPELTSSIHLMKFPSLPQIPEQMRGKMEFSISAAYVGDEADARRYIQQWLDWKEPHSNDFRTVPFAEIAKISNDPVDPVASYYSNEMLTELSDGLIDVIVARMTDPQSSLMITEIRHIGGGAIASVTDNRNAISIRDANFMIQMVGPAFDPEAYTAIKAAVKSYREAINPYVNGRVYLNFTKSSTEESRVRDAYPPETVQRLVALKAHYDPDNRFRYSFPLVE